MAVKDSGELAWGSRYSLGEYSFRIERSSVPGSTNDKIEAICTKGGKNARKSIQIPSSAQIEGWYVEANETEASVYIIPKAGEISIAVVGTSSVSASVDGNSVNASMSCVGTYSEFLSLSINGGAQQTIEFDCGGSALGLANYYGSSGVPVSMGAGGYHRNNPPGGPGDQGPVGDFAITGGGHYSISGSGVLSFSFGYVKDYTPATFFLSNIRSSINIDSGDKLVGRFAIEIEDAGGDGPGSDWIDPGDYDPDWEEGDPTHTLYVTVTGALSGRHNDPIADPSYSYIPADKDTVKDYGCGGDGGHGGGGGAGASTVVIHKFATNQANSKEVTAIARRHGYGSGGGKGGKGGDGCILVYY